MTKDQLYKKVCDRADVEVQARIELFKRECWAAYEKLMSGGPKHDVKVAKLCVEAALVGTMGYQHNWPFQIWNNVVTQVWNNVLKTLDELQQTMLCPEPTGERHTYAGDETSDAN